MMHTNDSEVTRRKTKEHGGEPRKCLPMKLGKDIWRYGNRLWMDIRKHWRSNG